MRARMLLLRLIAGLAVSSPALAQQSSSGTAVGLIANPPVLNPPAVLVTVPDSIRQRVGYQHWKGAAIGGGLGALAGLVLALTAHGNCSDCTSDTAPIGKVTLAGAGLGSAFGFLVGLASPRHRWVKDDGE